MAFDRQEGVGIPYCCCGVVTAGCKQPEDNNDTQDASFVCGSCGTFVL